MIRHTTLCVAFTIVMCVPALLAASPVQSPHENLKLECAECHTTATFERVEFDHNRHTDFPLQEGHRNADCRGCHSIKDFSAAAQECTSCHTDIHEAKLGPDCTRCHSDRGWTIFDGQEIHQETDFPFMGRHMMADCRSCHPGLPRGDFTDTRSRCVACHQMEYLETQSPMHAANAFSTDCQECHEMNLWRPARLDNHDVFFPIYGGTHAGAWAECAECHSNPAVLADFTCLPCHVHNQTDMDTRHQAVGGYAYISVECLVCHPRGEVESFGQHDALYFPIYSGPHQGQWTYCSTCHIDPGNRKVIDCLSCHAHRVDEMNGKHAGFPGYAYESSACLSCHPDGLKGQFTAHDANYFPIYSGAHQATWVECLECHTLATDRTAVSCFSCHDRPTADLTHNGFPGYTYESATCLSCHPDGTAGAFTVHDATFFPIYSGVHAGTWVDCGECHTVPANRAVFDCLTCHAKPATDPIHSGITGYAYESNACLTCHPDGSAADFTAHDATYFPIFSGTHLGTWSDCAQCHTDPTNRAVFDCLTCHAQPETNGIHGGMTGYAYQSSACYTCHPDGRKGQYTNHDADFFPIFSGVHNNKWASCTTCHTVPTDRSQFTCFDCHTHNEPKMNDVHSGEGGYSYDSNRCYSCHPNGRA